MLGIIGPHRLINVSIKEKNHLKSPIHTDEHEFYRPPTTDSRPFERFVVEREKRRLKQRIAPICTNLSVQS